MFLLLLSTCRNPLNPVDPEGDEYVGYESVDSDGDGIGSYDDVDEISLLRPENDTTLDTVIPTLVVYQFNPDKITAYHIQINTSSDFTGTMILDKEDYPSNSCIVPTGKLLDFETYYWRARAYDGTKWSDGWSEIRSFSINTGNELNCSPAGGDSLDDTTPYLDWDDTAGAASYEVEFALSEAGLDESDIRTTVESGYQIPDTDALAYGNTCYWRVRGVNEEGTVGIWSSIYSFSIQESLYAEINIRQGTTIIASSDIYGFVSTDVGTSTSVIFTIENTGDENLELTGSPLVAISGTDSSEFSVTTQPASSVSSGSSTTFVIAFSPSGEGSKTASVLISNNDSDENPFIFTITGSSSVSVGQWDSSLWDECIWGD